MIDEKVKNIVIEELQRLHEITLLESKKQQILSEIKQLSEITDKERYENVVFLQGDEAEEPLKILNDEGEDAALEYLKQWHYPGEHMGTNKLGAGTDDRTYKKDNYIMDWNSRIGYIGLQYDTKPKTAVDEKIELTFLRVDPDTGNLIYRGTDGNNYVEIDGEINDMTDQSEPLGPVYNVKIKAGEPIYNPEDRFGRNPGSKRQSEELSEEIEDMESVVPNVDGIHESDFETGAISSEIDNLILYVDTTRQLAEKRDEIYMKKVENPDYSVFDDFKYFLISTVLPTYKIEHKEDHNLSEQQIEDFALLYSKDFKNWKQEHMNFKENIISETDNLAYKGRKIDSFKTAEDFQNWIRKNQRTPDWVAVAGVVYTMDNYDGEGREISYGNVSEEKMLTVKTENRYGQLGFSDAMVEEDDLFGWRNDINYLDQEKELDSSWKKLDYPEAKGDENIDENTTVISFDKKISDITNFKNLPKSVRKLIQLADHIWSSGFQELLGAIDKRTIWSAGGSWSSRSEQATFTIDSIGGKLTFEEFVDDYAGIFDIGDVLDKLEEKGVEDYYGVKVNIQWNKNDDKVKTIVTETKDVKAMYRKAGMEPPKGKGIHTKKFHKCVTSVGAKDDVSNPYAVCMSSIGKKDAVHKFHQRQDENIDEILDTFDQSNPKIDLLYTDSQGRVNKLSSTRYAKNLEQAEESFKETLKSLKNTKTVKDLENRMGEKINPDRITAKIGEESVNENLEEREYGYHEKNPKIDLFYTNSKGDTHYVSSTNWATSLKQAKEEFKKKYLDPKHIQTKGGWDKKFGEELDLNNIRAAYDKNRLNENAEVKESPFFKIETFMGSDDFEILKNIVNQGIDSNLEGFTKSKFFPAESDTSRFIFAFHLNEMPVLLRRLQEKTNDEKYEALYNDIKDVYEKEQTETLAENEEGRYLSDEEIEQSYRDYDISHFDVNPSGFSGGIQIDFKDREGIFDNWIRYDSGKIAFEHWFPENVYLDLVYYINKKLTESPEGENIAPVNEGLRKHIKKIINEEFSTFEPEDTGDMQGDAYEQFLKDFHSEHPDEPLPTATPKDVDSLVQSLKHGNLSLPSDEEDLKYAEKNLERQLSGEGDPEIMKRKMDRLGGKDSINEESERPGYIGSNYNEINKFYELTKDDFTFVPASMKYWNANTQNCMLWNKLVHFRNEEDFQNQIKNKKFFFILYNNKMYIYLPEHKVLYDCHENKVNSKGVDQTFVYQINQMIKGTLEGAVNEIGGSVENAGLSNRFNI